MKRPLIPAILAFCVIAGAALLLAGWHTPKARVVATFQTFAKGTSNWAVFNWFIQTSPQRAQLMQEWLESGTNAAQFAITNNTEHAIRVLPLARFETSDQKRDTPVLTARNFRGVYLAPGEAKSVQVPSLPHGGRWRVGFCYARNDGGGHLLKDAKRGTIALLTGARTPLEFQDDLRDPITFFSEWIEK